MTHDLILSLSMSLPYPTVGWNQSNAWDEWLLLSGLASSPTHSTNTPLKGPLPPTPWQEASHYLQGAAQGKGRRRRRVLCQALQCLELLSPFWESYSQNHSNHLSLHWRLSLPPSSLMLSFLALSPSSTCLPAVGALGLSLSHHGALFVTHAL